MSGLGIFSEMESEVRGYIRSFPTVFARASGSHMYDADGKSYIDFFSGAGALNYGHNDPVMKQRIIDYLTADGPTHSLDMATEAKAQFIETFSQNILAPRSLDYKLQFTGPTGTNAVEAALKIARQATGRSGVVAFTRAFHGVSGGALAATSAAKFRRAAGFHLENVTFLPYEGYLGPDVDTLAYLEKVITDPSSGMELPAAVILETLQGEGGVNVGSVPWLQALAELCGRYGILIIVDDIQVGCGRTGPFFSFEVAGIVPDIVTLSKSISGYGLPMALVLMRRDLDIWKPGAHNGTFRGNNLAFVGAATAIDTYWKDSALSASTEHKGQRVQERFAAIAEKYPDYDFDIRGRGLIQGLESRTDQGLADRVSAEAFSRGLLLETCGPTDQVVKLMPALTIDDALLDDGLDILDASVAAVIAKS